MATLFVQALTRYGDRTAIVDGKARHSYWDLSVRVGRLLTLFDRLGWPPGTTVALGIPMGFDFLSWYIACQIGGITVLDLPPQLVPEVLRHIVEASGADHVIVQAATANPAALENLQALPVRVSVLGTLAPYPELAPLVAQCEPAPLDVRPAPACAAISTSSGSTGKPKALAFTGEALASLTLLHLATLDYPRDPVTVTYRTSFATMGVSVVPTLLRGGVVATLTALDTQAIAATAAAVGANLLYLTPDTLYALADDPGFAAAARKLRLVLYSGQLAPAKLPELREKFGPVFVNLYGCSEANPAVVQLPEEHDYTGRGRGSAVGRGLLGVEVRIQDEAGQRLPAGQVGEIVIKSPARMTAYVGQPERTAETIRDGWVRTGDIGWITEDDFIYIVDRLAFAVASRGRQVYPGQIDAILRDHPAVRACTCVGLEDAGLGHRICAAVVLSAAGAATAHQLAEFVRARDPNLPIDDVVFVPELPRSPLTHKVDRVRLKRLLTGPPVEA
ncbi:MAG TPA: class I adenylate-forming enzyme family protein [Ramlibacter sp.]|nr:class I adenylate-forming enzyme family protein [Ramlibacter sp.]